MDYRIIVLDIDGTLTNSRKEISEPTLQALLEVQDKGYKVVLASGRPTAGIHNMAKQLRLAQYGSYVLAYNGARIIDCKTNQIIYQKTIPRNTIPMICEAAAEYKVGLITYQDDCIIAGTPVDTYIEKESQINGIPIKEVPDFKDYVNFDINKCLMTAHPAHLEKVEGALKNRFNKLLNIYRSEPFFLEIMPQNIDKAHSLMKLLSSIGLNSEQMICCGDGFNDISMIECAGLGVAMENAQELVKSSADYITSSNDDNGILQVIEKFLI